MNKKCKDCQIELTNLNAAKKNKGSFRNQCRKCRSIQSMIQAKNDPKRKEYVRNYLRRKGIVKQYACLGCKSLCYKKYYNAYCSDKCRFLSYVKKEDKCWIWVGSINRSGYGKFCYKGIQSAVASRVSYELFKGSIGDALFVCHLCDIKRCVNPDHLWIGSHVENMKDMAMKGRSFGKFSLDQRKEIKSLIFSGISNKEIIKLYGISNSLVSNIKANRIWKYV